jgi:3-oxoacyl-[acyl-carrier-protein] synthase II
VSPQAAVTGWSVLSPASHGTAAHGTAAHGTAGHGEEPLPRPAGHSIGDFDIRRRLGRKGTGFFDRATGLGVIACGQAIEDSGISVGNVPSDRIGVVLGTTVGSLKSTMEFSAETLIQDRPYLVNPGLFPNTVLNCVAGQAAIWYGLKGVNATVAGGPLAMLNVLRYATRVLARGYADVLLAGVVEEFTAHAAWAAHLSGHPPAGEGAAVFVLERPEAARAAGRGVDAELLAVTTGFGRDVNGCVREVIAKAGLDSAEAGPLARAAAERQELLKLESGDCQAASGGLELAALLARQRDGQAADGALSLLTARTREGGCGAAVLRGCSRAGGYHGQRRADVPG